MAQQYYDSWSHKFQIFITRLTQFISLTIALGTTIWLALAHYFPKEIAFYNHPETFNLLQFMCFFSGIIIAAWIFMSLIIGKSQTGDKHHRGSCMVD